MSEGSRDNEFVSGGKNSDPVKMSKTAMNAGTKDEEHSRGSQDKGTNGDNMSGPRQRHRSSGGFAFATLSKATVTEVIF